MFSRVIVAEKCRFSPFWEIVETTQQPLGEPAESLPSGRTNCLRGLSTRCSDVSAEYQQAMWSFTVR